MVSANNDNPFSLSHTGHSSARWISSKRALRGLARLGGRRLLKGMLGRLLILGRGRGKTGTTTSLVGHNTTEQVTGAMTDLGRLTLRSCMCRRSDMRNSLNAALLELMSQNADLSFVALRQRISMHSFDIIPSLLKREGGGRTLASS